MNKSKIIIFSAIVMLLQSAAVQSIGGQELFRALLSLNCVSTNQDGTLVYERFGNQDLISSCAQDEGITNVTGLHLVYTRASNALQVVTSTNNSLVGTNFSLVGSNQLLICTPLTFGSVVSLSGTNTNKVELLASVFVETNTVANGTLAATERFTRNSSNELTGFSLVGRIQYATAASGTNSAMICTGVLVAGSQVSNENDQDEENENEGGHNGNHGNHGNGNNGNNGNGNNGNGNNGHHKGR